MIYGGTDEGLAKLLFDYGRYLLIECSRPGDLPATLQGIWNKDFMAPWDSKYTININTEMNYWPAEVCALPKAWDHGEVKAPAAGWKCIDCTCVGEWKTDTVCGYGGSGV